jgi:hypothetical protein
MACTPSLSCTAHQPDVKVWKFALAVAPRVGAQVIPLSLHINAVLSCEPACNLKKMHPQICVFRAEGIG